MDSSSYPSPPDRPVAGVPRAVAAFRRYVWDHTGVPGDHAADRRPTPSPTHQLHPLSAQWPVGSTGGFSGTNVLGGGGAAGLEFNPSGVCALPPYPQALPLTSDFLGGHMQASPALLPPPYPQPVTSLTSSGFLGGQMQAPPALLQCPDVFPVPSTSTSGASVGTEGPGESSAPSTSWSLFSDAPVARVEPKYLVDLNDAQLIHYLRCKTSEVPLSEVVMIHDVNVYGYAPENLAERYQSWQGKWYFFASRDRKYLNGNRPSRSAGNGYWKATGKKTGLQDEIGFKTKLVFHEGKQPNGVPTPWVMNEYLLPSQIEKSLQLKGTKKLDDCVLCAIYYSSRKTKSRTGGNDNHAPVNNSSREKCKKKRIAPGSEIACGPHLVDPLKPIIGSEELWPQLTITNGPDLFPTLEEATCDETVSAEQLVNQHSDHGQQRGQDANLDPLSSSLDNAPLSDDGLHKFDDISWTELYNGLFQE